jgi:hypothetical protein
MTLSDRSGKTPSEHRFFRIRPTPGAGYRRNRRAPAAFFEHEKGMDMTDQRPSNSGPTLKRNERFIFGADIFTALIGGLLLYTTRQREEPSNQGGLISAPETPAVPGEKRQSRDVAAERAALLRQKLNRAFTQPVGITLALLRQLDDLPGDDLCCGVGSIGQAQRAQGVFERGREDLDLVWSKYVIFQQATDRHGNGSRFVSQLLQGGSQRPSPSSPRTEADDAPSLVRPHFIVGTLADISRRCPNSDTLRCKLGARGF